MFNISNYLQKFKNAASGHIFEKDSILEIIFNLTNARLQKKDILIKNFILYINTNPVVKNEIFIKKTTLLETFAKNKTMQKIIDIR